MWCEYNGSSVLPREDKPASYFYCYKVPPPSYNHNWTDLHYAASHGNVRRIHEIIHKTGNFISLLEGTQKFVMNSSEHFLQMQGMKKKSTAS